MKRSRIPIIGFTLLELLVVVAIIAILAALLLPALSRSAAKGRQVHCLSQLRQVGVAFQMFAHEHNDQFPMQVSTNGGGALELNRRAPNVGGVFVHAFRNFHVLSNELVTPQLLICRADKRHVAATNFASLKNENVSYLVATNATPREPNSIVALDWNLTNATIITDANRPLGLLEEFGWTAAVHDRKGNVLFADGRVELVKNVRVIRTSAQPALVPTSTRPAGTTPARSGPPARDESAIDRAKGSQETTGLSFQSFPQRAESSSTVKPESPSRQPAAQTNVVTTALTNTAAREAWDTDGFRTVAALAQAGYLFSLLLALVMLLIYFLHRRRQARRAG